MKKMKKMKTGEIIMPDATRSVVADYIKHIESCMSPVQNYYKQCPEQFRLLQRLLAKNREKIDEEGKTEIQALLEGLRKKYTDMMELERRKPENRFCNEAFLITSEKAKGEAELSVCDYTLELERNFMEPVRNPNTPATIPEGLTFLQDRAKCEQPFMEALLGESLFEQAKAKPESTLEQKSQTAVPMEDDVAPAPSQSAAPMVDDEVPPAAAPPRTPSPNDFFKSKEESLEEWACNEVMHGRDPNDWGLF